MSPECRRISVAMWPGLHRYLSRKIDYKVRGRVFKLFKVFNEGNSNYQVLTSE